MKKTLLLVVIFLFSVLSYAQCNADYDFGAGVEFGVSPNPSLGESFETGVLGESYFDVIHILVPTDAGNINPNFAGYIIDSLDLIGVSIQNGSEIVPISTIGLDFECNNNGETSSPCMFLGGGQYCAAISGVPTLFGEFPLTINVMGYVNVFGSSQAIPYFFDQYTLSILETPVDVEENVVLPALEVSQNVPNPFKNKTNINFVTKYNDTADLTIRNLLGEIVLQKMIETKPGNNTYLLDADELNSGLYMFSLEVKGNKVTKRMVINK